MANDQKLILFSHIPKTAGWTLNHEFLRVLGDRAIVANGFIPLKSTLAGRTEEARQRIRYIGGHVTCDQYAEALSVSVGEHFLISLIRDPLRRAISYYLFILRNDVPPMKRIRDPFVGKSFEYFVEHSAETQPELIVNAQCKYFCGEADADKAMQAIDTHYALVANSRRFPEFYNRVRQESGDILSPWSDDRSLNVTPPAQSEAEVQMGRMPADLSTIAPPHVVRKVEEIAAADFELVEQFENRYQGYYERGSRPA
ncbi:sulfotransferase family 2 domain-containing protein [Pseudohoeflea coraliihabitans]|uniref:Sulfotransferase family protein n=1 Tax=Pseudohoeflea coraliihabitans TaxID=2860393 RepID=A0ABS6WMT3_9HYPH|nr:sulfotransferase family 2 domain-containing protein [Pseudohoeflea sp. DP4N28-3]MBW3097258.1 sulfotransferase family protein [Pseudohoeflea sp. DP4N28-3]